MATYTLTKWQNGREIDCETVDADSAEQAVLDATGWLTENERKWISYTATEETAE